MCLTALQSVLVPCPALSRTLDSAAVMHIRHSCPPCQAQWILTQGLPTLRHKAVQAKCILAGLLRRGLFVEALEEGSHRLTLVVGLVLAMTLVGRKKPQGYARVQGLLVRMHHLSANRLIRKLTVMALCQWLLGVALKACILSASPPTQRQVPLLGMRACVVAMLLLSQTFHHDDLATMVS